MDDLWGIPPHPWSRHAVQPVQPHSSRRGGTVRWPCHVSRGDPVQRHHRIGRNTDVHNHHDNTFRRGRRVRREGSPRVGNRFAGQTGRAERRDASQTDVPEVRRAGQPARRRKQRRVCGAQPHSAGHVPVGRQREDNGGQHVVRSQPGLRECPRGRSDSCDTGHQQRWCQHRQCDLRGHRSRHIRLPAHYRIRSQPLLLLRVHGCTPDADGDGQDRRRSADEGAAGHVIPEQPLGPAGQRGGVGTAGPPFVLHRLRRIDLLGAAGL